MEVLEHVVGGLPAFTLYFVVSLTLLAIWLVIYLRITPYREITLIRQGNAAAALSLSGNMLGFVVPLAHTVAQSANLPDMLLWGGVALAVQLLVYVAATRIIPDIARDIPDGKVAQGAFLGALLLATGILNAACLTY